MFATTHFFGSVNVMFARVNQMFATKALLWQCQCDA